MSDKPSVLRETDDEARRLARTLLRAARHAALAVIDPDNGYPFASRVLVGTDIDGVPVILVSALSTHTKALSLDPRASLLTGEPGKGDPLAHPRLSVQCRAEKLDRNGADHDRIRTRFLARHPKAKLYIDFPDFSFFRLEPQSASLNGGFGRAYVIPGEDLVIQSPANAAIAEHADEIVRDLVGRHPSLLRGVALKLHAEPDRTWQICGLDAAGFDLFSGEIMLRYEFDNPVGSYDSLNSYISKIEYSIPEI
jgi:hypothetical protein